MIRHANRLQIPDPKRLIKPQKEDQCALCAKSGLVTHLKSDLQCVSGHLQDSSLSKLPWHTHPGVGCEHGASQLLAGNNQHMVGDHCRDRGEGETGRK